MSGTVDTEPSSTAPAGGPAPTRQTPRVAAATWGLTKRFLIAREGSITVVTVLLAVYFALSLPSSSNFVTSENFDNMLPYFAPYAILAAGEVFLMINGEIDLSIGGVFLFSPIVFFEVVGGGIPALPALIITLLVCVLIGAVNGFITAFLGLSSFITTLAALFVLSGLALIISHAQLLVMPGSLGSPGNANQFDSFAGVFGAGTYSELFWALGIVFVLQLALSRTRWGLHTIAVGSNRIAAAEAGVKVRVVLMRNFVVCSTLAGLVGILESERAAAISPDPSSSGTTSLDGIAAAVIGGTLLIGGAGTVVGALIGALFLGILQDGLAVKGVNADYLDFFFGIAIVVAMLINVFIGRVRRRSGLA